MATEIHMRKKLMKYCKSQRYCSKCEIHKNFSNHKCGCGYTFYNTDAPCCIDEVIKYYKFLFPPDKHSIEYYLERRSL